MARTAAIGDEVLWMSDQSIKVPATVTRVWSTGNVDVVVSDTRAPANPAVLNIAQDTAGTPAVNTWDFAAVSGVRVATGTTPSAGASGTLNAAVGKFVVSTAGGTYTLTNSAISTSSLVYAWVQQSAADATALYVKNVAVTAGQAVFTLNATPTASTTFAFQVIN